MICREMKYKSPCRESSSVTCPHNGDKHGVHGGGDGGVRAVGDDDRIHDDDNETWCGNASECDFVVWALVVPLARDRFALGHAHAEALGLREISYGRNRH